MANISGVKKQILRAVKRGPVKSTRERLMIDLGLQDVNWQQLNQALDELVKEGKITREKIKLERTVTHYVISRLSRGGS